VNPLQHSHEEPVPLSLHRTGSFDSRGGDVPFEIALEWAGDRRIAVLLSGSHASSEAVWAEVQGRRYSLSDVDLYIVLEDRAACRAAEARARAARATLEQRLLDAALAAPLEVAFLTSRDLAALPARPGTIELKRRGRVLEGDTAQLERVPRIEPRDVSAEEITLLLENRAFELLAAHARLSSGALDQLRARHATHKVALDLAAVLVLERGVWPDGALARIEWLRAHGLANAALEAMWQRALNWRRDPVAAASPAVALAEWREVVRHWCDLWARRAPGAVPAPTPDPYELALRVARRARARRRLRQAARFTTRSGRGPSPWARWRFAWRGTPQHRLNATAAVLLLQANESAGAVDIAAGGSALAPRARSAISRLGAIDAPASKDWNALAREAVERWDLWILDGQRSAWRS
jgi:predicted nucleotidyltransferase